MGNHGFCGGQRDFTNFWTTYDTLLFSLPYPMFNPHPQLQAVITVVTFTYLLAKYLIPGQTSRLVGILSSRLLSGPSHMFNFTQFSFSDALCLVS